MVSDVNCTSLLRIWHFCEVPCHAYTLFRLVSTFCKICFKAQRLKYSVKTVKIMLTLIPYSSLYYIVTPGPDIWFKVAEHCVSARFCWCNLARAQGFQKQTCRQQSDHFIYSTPAPSVLFFSTIGCSVLMALVFYYNDMLQKVTMQRIQ